jgi:photosystem II stability/assembly factor-like uncharacterized protein
MRALFIVLCLILSFILSDSLYSKWESIIYDTTCINLVDVSIATPNTAIAVGEFGVIRITTDSGKTWSSSLLPIQEKIISVSCYDSLIAALVTETGKVWRSTDVGKTWAQVQLPNGVIYHKIKFLNGGAGFLLGNNGYLLKSTDKGVHWNVMITGNHNNFNDIAYYKDNTYLLIGDNATLLKTTNGGQNWQAIITGYNNKFLNIQVVNDTVIGIMADSLYVITTTNSGTDWRKVCVSPNYSELYVNPEILSFYMLDENQIDVIVRDNWANSPLFYEYVSFDGGATWDWFDLYGFPFGNVDIFFLNRLEFNENGYGIGVGGNGCIYSAKASDSSFLDYNTILDNANYNFYSMDAFDKNNIAILATNTVSTYILESFDNGATWQKQLINVANPDTVSGFTYKSISYPSKDNIILTANINKRYKSGSYTYLLYRGFVARTTDNGQTFKYFETPNIIGFDYCSMVDDKYGIISSGGDTLYYTTNGGTNWNDLIVEDINKPSYNNMVVSPAPNIFYVRRLGYDSTTLTYYLLRTYNNGANWERLDNPIYGRLMKFKFADALNGYSIGYFDSVTVNGKQKFDFVAKTTDGGSHWNYIFLKDTTDRNCSFKDFNFFDAMNGIVVGREGRIIRTSDGGATWLTDIIPYLGIYDIISNIHYPSTDCAFAITWTGFILKYTPDDTTGVKEFNGLQNKQLIISPNPVENILNLNISSDSEKQILQIYTPEGVLVLQSQVVSQIDISNLTTGIYFIRLSGKTGKFIKL